MDEKSTKLVDSLTTNFPWFLVKVIKGVDVNNIHMEGFAELPVENKFQGKYMNICQILRSPQAHSLGKDDRLQAGDGDLVCVWATSVESFKLFEYGTVSLIRNADIFMRVVPLSDLYQEIMEEIK